MLKFVMFLVFYISIYSQILGRYHPEIKWKKFETENFTVLYHDGTKRSAIKIAEIAETIYGPVTQAYKFEPKKKITWIVKDIDDYSNGAAYFLDYKIEIWTEHLDYDLRGTHDWLWNVVTHEFIHMIHIQKSFSSSLNIPFAFFQILNYEKERRKDVVRGFPNHLINYPILLFKVPAWLAEGFSQVQVKDYQSDYRDSQREMILRDRFKYNKVLTLDEMSRFGKTSIGNESTYNQGFSLSNYIIEKYGHESFAKVSERNSEWSALVDYDEVFKDALGKSLNDIYNDWYQEEKKKFDIVFDNIKGNEVKGKSLHKNGEANFYPKYSPDTTQIAFVSSANSSRMSQNKLFLMNQKTKELKVLTAAISSQIEWSGDGKFLVYSKQTEANNWGSHYNDLYIYDIESEIEERITFNLRARNPSINEKNQIVFVTAYDGGSNLMLFDYKKDQLNKTVVSFKNHNISNSLETSYLSSRRVKYNGENLRFLTKTNDFTQFFHPHLLENKLIVDYSTSYQRQIQEIDIETGTRKDLIANNFDNRNPRFHNGSIYFSSDRTGIFNIYKIKNGKTEQLTNVTGSAFMPDILDDKIVYSLYDSIGFQIAELNTTEASLNLDSQSLSKKDGIYNVPEAKDTKIKLTDVASDRQKFKFNSYYAIPRLFLDDKRMKFGAVIQINEILDRASVLAAAAYNLQGERDIFTSIEYRGLKIFNSDPIIFAEAYNQSTEINDKLSILADENGQRWEADRGVVFTLWQFEFGFKKRMYNLFDWRFAYVLSTYKANIDPAVTNPVYINGQDLALELPFFRYDYHIGKSFDNRFLFQLKDPSFTGEIVPESGLRLFGQATYNKNKFLKDFAFNTSGVDEIYNKYDYWYLYFSMEKHLPFLFDKSGLTVKVKAEGNLKAVDDFYDTYVGGWIGLKGYPFFSIHGRQSVYAMIKYNQLIGEDLAWDWYLLKIRNIALASYFETGDAWTNRKIKFKRDIGFQIKMDTYDFLKIAFDASYPLNVVRNNVKNSDEIVIYPQEWRFYFTINFEFDLQESL